MKLALRIEDEQRPFIHSDLIRTLELLAKMSDLDVVLEALRASVDAYWWSCGRGGNHVWLSKNTREGQPIRVAMIVALDRTERPSRNWDANLLSLQASGQQNIAEGDIVRSYDFPGSSEDCYLEGVVEKIEDERDRLLIHVTREVWQGEEQQVSRFKVWSPLGVSSMNAAPCVFLIAKRKGEHPTPI